MSLPAQTEEYLILSSIQKNIYAYVWLLMKGDSYLPGIITSVYSVKRTNFKADLVVMVTPDVSEKSREIILKCATHICEVPYITISSLPLKSARQKEMYSHWINSAYTKLNILALPYDKVIFMDADTIHLKSSFELFQMNTPAAPYANPFVRPLGNIKDHYIGRRGSDGYPIHNAEINKKLINTILKNGGILPISSSLIITPNIEDYNNYLKMLNEYVENKQPFGYSKCINGYDEQSICKYYSEIENKNWRAVHQRYNYIAWKNGFLAKGDYPYVLHYMSENKPWLMDPAKYDDLISWYKMASEAIDKLRLDSNDLFLKKEYLEMAMNTDDTFIKKFIDVDSCLFIKDL